MTTGPTSLSGGESVFCINESQLRDAKQLAEADPVSSPRIQNAIRHLEASLTRNERAAIAFVLIERLRSFDR